MQVKNQAQNLSAKLSVTKEKLSLVEQEKKNINDQLSENIQQLQLLKIKIADKERNFTQIQSENEQIVKEYEKFRSEKNDKIHD